jgi:hypothetical protein
MTPLVITETTARRFLLGTQGLWPTRRFAGKEGAAEALVMLGRLQLDPVSLVARSHDLVLMSRVRDYVPRYLQELIYRDRRFFEYGGHLDVYPNAEYAYWDLHKVRRKSEPRVYAFMTEHAVLVEEIRGLVRERGPLTAGEIPNDTRVQSGRARNAAGLALYNLWLTGELMTHSRRDFERVYDLASRIEPDGHVPLLDEPVVRAHAARTSLERAALPTLREWWGGVGYMLAETITRADAGRYMEEKLLARGVAVPVTVEGHKTPRFVLADSLDILAELSSDSVPATWRGSRQEAEVTFLSPLDNLLARERVLELFGFEYIWEIYKPAAKRRFGAYVMPILYEDRLVGRLDPKLDRAQGRLDIQGLWIEAPGLAADRAFRASLDRSLQQFAETLGARDLHVSTAARL